MIKKLKHNIYLKNCVKMEFRVNLEIKKFILRYGITE